MRRPIVIISPCIPVAHRQRARSTRFAAILAMLVACIALPNSTQAEDVSAPAILQIYEAKWTTIENRMADVHDVGYGRLWLPPPSRAGSNFSVGYDVFDRFDLGAPRNETLYGTETSLKSLVRSAHNASLSVYTDFVPNHNGFRDSYDASFVAEGGYPGFVMQTPGDPFGDFHNPGAGGEIEGQISDLYDIAQEKSNWFIRHPTAAGNPNNIPAGTRYNKPSADNARFYPDQALGGLPLSDPHLGSTVTRYNFNATNPLAGDPVVENSTDLLMRNAQWMIEVIGVDGFRIDAAKHFPEWVLDYLDQATFRANPRLNLDGSINPTFMFSEAVAGVEQKAFIQNFIRKDLPSGVSISPANTTVGGNRDALDFPLFFAMRDNLTGNGLQNNWHNIRFASQDTQDDGLRNGSQGVVFAQSHDDFGPHLQNVAYAYTLMLPGNAIVYTNAKEFGNGRDFPKDGKVDALGGFYGDTITKLVGIRNSHGRGDFHERWIDEAFGDGNGDGQKSAIYVYEPAASAVVGLSNRNDSFIETRSGVQTAFAPNTILVELTGNANDATVDPTNAIRQTLRVNGAGHIDLSIPSNAGHGRGYVVYGLATPQGSLSFTNVASTLAGATPTAANNGTARLAGIDVITADTFNLQLNTTPVSLVNPDGPSENPASLVRDVHADGDTALFKIDGGLDLNGTPGVDHVTPGSVDYGFEEFTDVRSPGYVYSGGVNVGTGLGQYQQTIDATQLAEGRHYVTVRAFRHRDAATGGDGAPAVFTDFTKTIYVDRLAPEPELVSFEPFASNPGQTQNRDLVVRSTDGTASNMHFFLDLPASLTDQQVLEMVGSSNDAGEYDSDSYIRGYVNLRKGNHVATVVTYEPTGNYSVRRLPGLFADSPIGAGFGDLNGNGTFSASDILGTSNGSFEHVLYSQNSRFSAAADLDGDGLVTNLDLFALGGSLTAGNADAMTLAAYDQLLVKCGDVNQDGVTNGADVADLHASFGGADWLKDLNADGLVDVADVNTLITDILRTSPGDFNLDRIVDGSDFLLWQRNLGAPAATHTQGDANLDGVVNAQDLPSWQTDFGVAAPIAPSAAAASTNAVPEPATATLLALGLASLQAITRRR